MIGPSLIAVSRKQRRQRGFTLIEMIIVCAMISILLGIMVPVYKIHILHANEAVLKEDLYHMRTAIDQYTQDKNKAPQDLNDIMTAGDQTAPGITDVKSSSNLMSSEGTAYSSW